MEKIILASNAPRRREILEMVGIDFEIDASDIDEDIGVDEPVGLVSELSKRKAHAVEKNHPGCVIIGADTVVAVTMADGRESILGKPADADDASDMLFSLSGKTHRVHTGVTLLHIGADGSVTEEKTFCETTEVTFYPLGDRDIEAYVATGEPLDKAGAYGIQGRGAILVKEIKGDYLNVVGLPLARLWRELFNGKEEA